MQLLGFKDWLNEKSFIKKVNLNPAKTKPTMTHVSATHGRVGHSRAVASSTHKQITPINATHKVKL